MEDKLLIHVFKKFQKNADIRDMTDIKKRKHGHGGGHEAHVPYVRSCPYLSSVGHGRKLVLSSD